MAGLAPLLALALATTGDPALLVRLFDRAADEVVRRAGSRPVEVARVDDRTGGAAPEALRALLAERLAARRGAASSGERPVRAEAILSSGTRRTWLSVTLSDGPGRGDAFSVSVEGRFPPPAAEGPEPRAATIRVEGPQVDVGLEGRPVDVAWLPGERVLLLEPAAAVLVTVEKGHGRVRARLDLPAPWPVRAPAGVLSCDERGTCWALTSRMREAVLLSTEGDRLLEVARASALPWTGAPGGLRFRPGTNMIDVEVADLPPPPYLRVGGSRPGWAVSPSGWLGLPGRGWIEVPAGSAAAEPWPAVLALSSAAAPGAADEVRLVDVSTDPPHTPARLPVAGVVRALAAGEREAATARLVVVVEDHTQRSRLLAYRLVRLDARRANR